MRVTVLGDSIVRRLKENLVDGDFEVHCFPGATLRTLRHRLYDTYQQQHEPDMVVVHAGTNTYGSLDRALQDIKDLVEAVKCVTKCGNVVVSLIIPRWDSQERYEYVEELNTLFKRHFQTIDCRHHLLEEHFQEDGLHICTEHGRHFAEVFREKVKEHLLEHSVTEPLHVPKWWIPPLGACKSKKRKKADKVKLDSTTAAEDLKPKKSSFVKPPAWKTIATGLKRLNTSTVDGYTQIGMIRMSSPQDVKVVLPLPSGCMSTSRPAYCSGKRNTFTDLPRQPSPYVRKKMLGKAKARRQRRDRKSRARKNGFCKVS